MLESIQHFLTWLQNCSPLCVIIVQLSAVFILTVLACVIELTIYRHLYPRLKHTSNLWDDALLQALHAPLQFIIWVVGITYLFEIADRALPQFDFTEITFLLREILSLAGIFWFLIRYIKLFENKFIEYGNSSKKKIDRATTFAVGKLLRIAVAFIAILIFLQMLGLPISGLLAFGGAGALVVGLAAKDILANFFGGLMIYTDRPFTVGDWIRSPDREIEGTVEHIGWRLTRIRTGEQRPLYIPNAVFSSIAIENPARMRSRRIKTQIGLNYKDLPQIHAIVSELNEMIKQHPEVDHKQTNYARFISFAQLSLTIEINIFVKQTATAEYLLIQENLLLEVANVLKKYAAEFAQPIFIHSSIKE